MWLSINKFLYSETDFFFCEKWIKVREKLKFWVRFSEGWYPLHWILKRQEWLSLELLPSRRLQSGISVCVLPVPWFWEEAPHFYLLWGAVYPSVLCSSSLSATYTEPAIGFGSKFPNQLYGVLLLRCRFCHVPWTSHHFDFLSLGFWDKTWFATGKILASRTSYMTAAGYFACTKSSSVLAVHRVEQVPEAFIPWSELINIIFSIKEQA